MSSLLSSAQKYSQKIKKRIPAQCKTPALWLVIFFLLSFLHALSQVCSCLLVQREGRAVTLLKAGAGAARSCQNQPPAACDCEGLTATGGTRAMHGEGHLTQRREARANLAGAVPW